MSDIEYSVITSDDIKSFDCSYSQMANIVDSLRIRFKEQSDLGPQCVLIPDSLKN